MATPRRAKPTAGRDEAGPASGPGAGLPAKRLLGRSVVVLLGASAGGLSLLSRTLQALGVDMLEDDVIEGAGADLWADPDAAWRRTWITEANDALLAAIDRPDGHVFHALPFPAGWWRKPSVQKIRRDLTARLAEALEGHQEPWGFADSHTARLLPVWNEVFEQLGLSPIYVWVLDMPAPARRSRGKATDTAEIRWFAYGGDIFRYAGERLAAVVEEREWRRDPRPLMEDLVGRLQLRWRGTKLDLYETVSALLGEDDTAESSAVPTLPLAVAFHDAAARMIEDPDARAKVATMVESAELLRPLLAPFINGQPVTGGATPAGLDEDAARLRQELAALRRTRADLQRIEDGENTGEDVIALRTELQAREAETRWLHEQYRARLNEAEAEIDALRLRLSEGSDSPDGGAADAGELSAAQAEIQRLQSEMINLNNANERYLARIYELRKALEDQALSGRPG